MNIKRELSTIKDWTDARKKAFIVSVLRNGTQRWPPKYRTKDLAKTEKKTNPATGRLAQHYQCAKCQKEYTSKDIQVDHIIPVIGPEGFTTWDSYINNLYCDEDNLQVLCTSCHDVKTKKERKQRNEN